MKPTCSQRGTVLLDTLMSILVGAIVIGSAVSTFSNMWARSTELRLKTQLHTEARLILDLLAFDLRMTGSGLPLGQTAFRASDPAISQAALPVLPGASASSVTVQLNEMGTSSVISSLFDPSAGDRAIQTNSTSGFAVGDTIYLSDMPKGGSNGLRATVQGISSGTITIAPDYIIGTSAPFPAGSNIEPVKQVTYSNSASGITREAGSTTALLAPHSTVTLTYLDSSGSPLPTPLTATSISELLSAVVIHVTLRSAAIDTPDSQQGFTSTTSQTVALRNVNLNR
jgi:hypothetical protein